MLGRGHLAFALYNARLAVGLGTILALLAVALSTMGVYSVMTYMVAQRTREIGIRVALGGRTGDVLRLVIGHGLGLVGAGVLVGGAAAWLVARLLSGLLHGVSASDPVTYLATMGLLVSVGLLATLLPARRATKVDPMVALRSD
jgi:putative ABC transport system permease protein